MLRLIHARAGRLFAFALLLAPLPVLAADYQVFDGQIHRDGAPINLFGVNWFGAETLDHVPYGLWARNYRSMIEQIKQTGFNAVRVPVCPITLDNVPPTSIDYSKNTELQGLGSLEVLDTVLTEMAMMTNIIHRMVARFAPSC